MLSNDSPLISVIVPVYNVELYLDKCVNSIVNQTYKKLEIILIDDGSTDNSGKMCDGWAERDSRIKVIHQKNNGVSSARNKGIDISKGSYISFVDSDDFIDLSLYEEFVNKLYNHKKIDIFIFNYYKVSNKLCKGIKNSPKKDYLDELFLEKNVKGFIWNKIYSKKIIGTLKLNPKIKVCEDLLFNYQILAKNINIKYYYSSKSLYYYKISDDLNTTLKFYRDLTKFMSYVLIINLLETLNYKKSVMKKVDFVIMFNNGLKNNYFDLNDPSFDFILKKYYEYKNCIYNNLNSLSFKYIIKTILKIKKR